MTALAELLKAPVSDLFERNNSFRRPDVKPLEGLHSVDDLYEATPVTYRFPVPSVSRTWGMRPYRLSQATYDEQFSNKNFGTDCDVGKVLNKVNAGPGPAHVWVAGGAAAAPYYEKEITAGDVDFFIVGIDPSDSDALWGTVHRIFDAVRESLDMFEETENDGVGSAWQCLAPGVLTITHRNSKRMGRKRPIDITLRKYQIILRAYPSVSALIHAFDVPSACIAYDGTTAHMTTLGAYAQAYRVNLANPRYRSTTYEIRLEKYYKRGYALGLPNLKISDKTTTIEFPGLMDIAIRMRSGYLIVGEVTHKTPPEQPSDYVPAILTDTAHYYLYGEDISKYATARANYIQLIAGKPNYIISRCADYDTRDHMWLPVGSWYRSDADSAPKSETADESSENANADGENTGGENADGETKEVDSETGDGDSDDQALFDALLTEENTPEPHPPTFSEALSQKAFDNILQDVVGCVVTKTGALRVKYAKRYLGLTPKEIEKLVRPLADWTSEEKPDMAESLARFSARAKALYEETKLTGNNIKWWIRDDPGRQYTASRNPIIRSRGVVRGRQL